MKVLQFDEFNLQEAINFKKEINIKDRRNLESFLRNGSDFNSPSPWLEVKQNVKVSPGDVWEGPGQAKGIELDVLVGEVDTLLYNGVEIMRFAESRREGMRTSRDPFQDEEIIPGAARGYPTGVIVTVDPKLVKKDRNLKLIFAYCAQEFGHAFDDRTDVKYLKKLSKGLK